MSGARSLIRARLACIDDEAQGETLEFLWNDEVDASIVANGHLSIFENPGTDDPEVFSAYLHSIRWNTATAADRKLLQAPFRAGIHLDACPLVPLANRVTPLLRQRGVVDDQPGIVAANQLVDFDEQGCFGRSSIPNAATDEMMKLVIVHGAVTCRHRLNALAVARADQSRYIGRGHPPTRFMPKRIEELLKPALEILVLIRVHGRSSSKSTPYESRNSYLGDPKNAAQLKICQSSAWWQPPATPGNARSDRSVAG